MHVKALSRADFVLSNKLHGINVKARKYYIYLVKLT